MASTKYVPPYSRRYARHKPLEFQYGGTAYAGFDASGIGAYYNPVAAQQAGAASYPTGPTFIPSHVPAPPAPKQMNTYEALAAAKGTDPELERYEYLTTQTTGPLGADAQAFIADYEARTQRAQAAYDRAVSTASRLYDTVQKGAILGEYEATRDRVGEEISARMSNRSDLDPVQRQVLNAAQEVRPEPGSGLGSLAEHYRRFREPINAAVKPVLNAATGVATEGLRYSNIGPLLNLSESVGGPGRRTFAETIVPQNIEQAVLEALPGTGTLPDIARAGRRGAAAAGRVASEVAQEAAPGLGRALTAGELGAINMPGGVKPFAFKVTDEAADAVPAVTKGKLPRVKADPTAKALEASLKAGKEGIPDTLGKMPLGELRARAASMGLDPRGTASTLVRRIERAQAVAAKGPFTDPGASRALSRAMGERIPQKPPSVTRIVSESDSPIVREVGTPYSSAIDGTPPVKPPRKAPAGGGEPPEPPLNLPLGRRGGGSLERDLKGIGLSDDSNEIVRQFKRSLAGTTENLKGPGRLRAVTSRVSGDLGDSYLVEVANQERLLREALVKNELDKLPRLNFAGFTDEERMKLVADATAWVDEVLTRANQASAAWRADVLRTRYLGTDLAHAQAVLNARDLSLAAQQPALLDQAQSVLKEMRFGLDLGVTLQQGLKAVRVGGTSMATDAVARAGRGIGRMLGRNADGLGIYTNRAISGQAQRAADGLLETGSRAVGLERSIAPDFAQRSLRQRVARAPLEAVRKLSDFQYRQLDKVRVAIYEGRLYQAKLLGEDIADPLVRRRIADFANMATSTARTATDPRRALVERRVLLSPQLTRSQFAEMVQPLKSVRSVTDASNTVNQLASTAAVFGMAYAISEAFGVDMSFKDFLNTTANPLSRDFGRLTLNSRNSAGERIRWDFLPQYSTEKAVLKSLTALQEAARGDADAKATLLALGDITGKYGFGRLNVGISSLTNLAGVGYDDSGGFHYGALAGDSLDRGQILRNIAPLPLSLQDSLLRGETAPIAVMLNVLGGNAYGESDYSALGRVSKREFNEDFFSTDAVSQAKTIKQALADGEELDNKTKAGPYIYAANSALHHIQDGIRNGNISVPGGADKFVLQHETVGKLRDAFYEQQAGRGKKRSEIDDMWDNLMDALGMEKATRFAREQVVREFPEVAIYNHEAYNEGSALYDTPQWAWELARETAGVGQ